MRDSGGEVLGGNRGGERQDRLCPHPLAVASDFQRAVHRESSNWRTNGARNRPICARVSKSRAGTRSARSQDRSPRRRRGWRSRPVSPVIVDRHGDVAPAPPVAAIASAALANRLPTTWLSITRLASTRCGLDGKLNAIERLARIARDRRILGDDLGRRRKSSSGGRSCASCLLRADDLEHLAHRVAADLELRAAIVALHVLGIERRGERTRRASRGGPVRASSPRKFGQRLVDRGAIDRAGGWPIPWLRIVVTGFSALRTLCITATALSLRPSAKLWTSTCSRRSLSWTKHRVEAAAKRADLVRRAASSVEQAERSRIADDAAYAPRRGASGRSTSCVIIRLQHQRARPRARASTRAPRATACGGRARDVARHAEAGGGDRAAIGARRPAPRSACVDAVGATVTSVHRRRSKLASSWSRVLNCAEVTVRAIST